MVVSPVPNGLDGWDWSPRAAFLRREVSRTSGLVVLTLAIADCSVVGSGVVGAHEAGARIFDDMRIRRIRRIGSKMSGCQW